jgi:sialidase-1
MRNHWARSGGRPDLAGVRMVARSRDGGLTWTAPDFDRKLVEPVCQASILRYSWPEGREPSRLLFANPASRSRSRMTVRLSCDEGRTWPIGKTVYEGSSAYSCLAKLPDGRAGLLYERDDYGKLTFAAFTLSWLTEGQASPAAGNRP